MKRHRFFIKQSVALGSLVCADEDLINQWSKVLRFTSGEVVNLIDQTGTEGVAVITDLNKNQASVNITEILPKIKPLPVVNLYLAILKKENFELVVQKATEIGVASITPLVTDRTVKLGLNYERLIKISEEASEQSGRQTKTLINQPLTLADFLNQPNKNQTIVFSLNAGNISSLKSMSDCNILVGPEGGFTNEEESLLIKNGANLKSLGELTLRGETAAIVGSFLTVHNLI